MERMFYSPPMNRATYLESACKSALNRVSGMPFRWSLNPYRGCVHGCHYCYARATHRFLGLNAGDDFSRRIIVKTNMPEVLRRELGRSSWRRERVALGTATDPYQPCEGRYRITRRLLEALRDFATPVSVVTKSTLVLRDGDLLAGLARLPGTRVNVTITTLDPVLWRQVEPGTPPPRQRLEVMRRLASIGVPCGVYMAPILPGLSDTDEAIEAVASAARDYGATTFWAAPLRLAPLVKEHFLDFMDEAFPALAPRYARAYTDANAPRDYQATIERRIARARERHGFAGEEPRAAPAVPAHACTGLRQLPLTM